MEVRIASRKDIARIMNVAWKTLYEKGFQKQLINICEFCDGVVYQRDNLLFYIYDLAKRLNSHYGVEYRLLLLTKGCIPKLLEKDMSDIYIYSISVNTETVWEEFEKLTPSPYVRLSFLKKVGKVGYETRVRIDPIIPISLIEEYVNLVALLPEVDRVTLGFLRRSPKLKKRYYEKDWFGICKEKSIWGYSVPKETRKRYLERLIKDILNLGFKVGICKDEVGLEMLRERNIPNYCNCKL